MMLREFLDLAAGPLVGPQDHRAGILERIFERASEQRKRVPRGLLILFLGVLSWFVLIGAVWIALMVFGIL